MEKVEYKQGKIATIITVEEMAGLIRKHFNRAFMLNKLNWDSVALKDGKYILLDSAYVDGSFARSVANLTEMFKTDAWQNLSNQQYRDPEVDYVTNAFDCDTYAAFAKVSAHLAIAQYFPTLGVAPAFGTISYISRGSGNEANGVGHEINFYACAPNGNPEIRFFEPQEVAESYISQLNKEIKHGATISLTDREISSIFAVRV